jgi:hypothetical protein
LRREIALDLQTAFTQTTRSFESEGFETCKFTRDIAITFVVAFKIIRSPRLPVVWISASAVTPRQSINTEPSASVLLEALRTQH